MHSASQKLICCYFVLMMMLKYKLYIFLPDAKIVAFDGTDFVRINLSPMLVTHTNDIALRFKTPKAHGLLFSTSNRLTNDYLRATLENGKGKITTNLGGQMKVLVIRELIVDALGYVADPCPLDTEYLVLLLFVRFIVHCSDSESFC